MAVRGHSASDDYAARVGGDTTLSHAELLDLCATELELKSLVLDGLGDGIMVHSAKGEIVYFNPAAAVIYGYRQEDFAKLESWGWVPDNVRAAIEERLSVLHACGHLNFLSTGKTSDGSLINTEVHARLLEVPGFGEVIVSVIQDITERVAAQETIKHLAFHDTLTGLANRVLLDERLRMAMAAADRHGDIVGIVYLDLDAFKPINDSFGHAIGDLVLKQVADRLTCGVREYDTVARMGGDEFLVLFSRLETRASLAALGRKVRDCISAPVVIEGHNVTVSAKVGLATYRGGEAPDELISRADHAMYRARAKGVPGWEDFSSED